MGSLTRLLLPAFRAAVVAATLVGASVAADARVLRLAEWAACPGEPRMEVRTARSSYHRPGERSLEVVCVDAWERVSGPRTAVALAATFAGCFAVLFALFLGVALRRRHDPPEADIRLEPAARQRVWEHVASGRRIQAIREVRQGSGAGEEQARAYVDRLERHGHPPAGAPLSAELPPGGEGTPFTRLAELKAMLDRGLITFGEYESRKAELLAGM